MNLLDTEYPRRLHLLAITPAALLELAAAAAGTGRVSGHRSRHGDGSAGEAGGRATGGGNFPYSTGQVIMVDGGLTIPRL